MWVLLVAIALLGLKLAGIEPIASLSWWWIGVPLGVVFLWWEILDPMFAISQKRSMRRIEQRAQERKERQRKFLGLRQTPGSGKRD